MKNKLTGWNFIVYMLIKNHFGTKEFTSYEIYKFVPYFQTAYPKNFHIKEKIRQTLQNLRNKSVLAFLDRGWYQLMESEIQKVDIDNTHEFVYLISNDAIPDWIKIGRTNSLDQRLKDLYNTSVPLPFKLVDYIQTKNNEEARTLETCIHQIIDTINPKLRKDSEANRREFFKMNPDEGKKILKLVSQVMKLHV